MTTPRYWRDLQHFTQARIALGRTGDGIPTSAHLDFQAAHAAARDAVHTALDTQALAADLAPYESISVRSQAADRRAYLLRPDRGRRLQDADRGKLPRLRCDMAIVLADGLSALAVQRHAAPTTLLLLESLHREGLKLAPVIIATQARVALGDDIAAALGAAAVLVLIGERPGLSSPDSLGAYLTWQPRPGITTDAARNCVSNIRAAGLPPAAAAEKLLWLIGAMRRLRATGIGLKDEQPLAIEGQRTES